MRKLIALLFALICLLGSAVSESPATPTDLIEIEDDDFGYIDPSLIENETQQTYTFVIDAENCHYWWRVVVIL